MRTVDPDLWSKKLKKPPLNVVRPIKLGLKVTDFESRLRRSFHDAMIEYVKNCSVKGVKYVIDRDSPKPLRWLYLLVVLWSLVAGVSVFSLSTLHFLSRPVLSVTPQAELLPVRDLDFPAIALCSNNIISLEALDDYANYLYSLDKNHTFTLLEIKDNLLAFRGVIMRTVINYNPKFLYYLKETVRQTNVTDILYKYFRNGVLTVCSYPRGASALCYAAVGARDASAAIAFLPRELLTSAFVASLTPDFYERTPALRVAQAGTGLQVVVRDDCHDYSGVERPVDDIQILIFDGSQHPIVRAGIVRLYAAMRNASVFMSLEARVRVADRALAHYSEARRGCGSRSWSRCVSQCRARALRALCLCTPHTEPGHELCTLDHLECLAKHREKLNYFYPGEAVHDSLRQEEANSVHCNHCVRNCARPRYFAKAWLEFDQYDGDPHFFHQGISTPVPCRAQLAVERVYLSNQWVVVAGVTLVSVLELFYHVTVRWARHYAAFN